jgi:hypothetical protein
VRGLNKLALAAAVGAAALLAAELGLRAAKLGAPPWYQPDNRLGWSLRPYAHGHEHGTYSRVSPAGMHDARHPVDKREGMFRIALLGDEYSEALAVPLRQTWWWQLPVELARCGFQGDRKIEVLNFGVAGYSTAQESIVLETAVMRYRPDLVLVQFSQGDDVRENAKALAARHDRPFFAPDPHGGGLRLDESFTELRDFERRSQFRYQVARELAERSRVLQVLDRFAAIGAAHADASGALAALEPPRDARWEEAWSVTGALLGRMAQFAARNGAALAVVAVPHPLELERGLQDPEARLAELGRRHAIPVIPLFQDMTRAFYAPAGGWTPEGHASAARAVARGLCRR